jgi:hypothetical protein
MKKEDQSKRGSNGVGFALNKKTAKAWRSSGSKYWGVSPRVVALTLTRQVKTNAPSGRIVDEEATIIAGCSPTTGRPSAEKQALFGGLGVARGRGAKRGVVVMRL